jgi:glycosyltransferase involved in cell wall biosynthesis
MKVLHLISSGGMYGAENVVAALARDLQRMGHEASVGIIENTHCPPNDVASQFETRGLKVLSIPCRGRADRKTVRAIREILLSKDIGLLHTHGYKADIYGYLAARKLGMPIVATRHSQLAKRNGPAVWAYELLDVQFLRRFGWVVAVSHSIEEETRRIGIAPEKVSTIANGIDLLPFELASQERKVPAGDRLRVGTVGRLIERKGIDRLLKAARIILNEFPRTHFVIVGDGPYRESLEQLAKNLDIEGDVSFEGTLTDMASVYANVDIFVLPSMEEGLPIAVLEALASQRAVVATSVGAIPELIIPGQTGILVRPGEVDELADAVRSFILDPALRRELGKRGANLVRSQYSSERMSQSYFQLYEKLVKHKSSQFPELSVLSTGL